MKVIDTERIPIKMWLDDIEPEALAQAKNLANLPCAEKWIAIMPDSHTGYGMPIGGVMATKGIIIPNAVGVDIGCGMSAVRTCLNKAEVSIEMLKEIMGRVREYVPVGFKHQDYSQRWVGFETLPVSPVIHQQLQSATKQLGTLGGGNHFIEIQEDSDERVWIMVHSGSRNLGLKVANFYHKKAVEECEKWHVNLPTKDLAYMPMDSFFGDEYYEAMRYCVWFAKENRARIMDKVIDILEEEYFNNVEENRIDIAHNYAALEHHFGTDYVIHRKGSTRARNGEIGIIPGSMGTSSYIVVGKGNSDSFMSCSHGAGRRMGRKAAKKNLNLEEEQEKMNGIVHGLRNIKDLDEAPGAYKDIRTVMENQSELVDIAVELKPLAVIKG